MSKTYTTEPYKVIYSALNKLEAYIAPTYGPAGRGILVDEGLYQKVLDDGFLAIDEFELPDPLENAVIKLVKEVSAKTNKRAGDGTTTATLLMISLVRQLIDSRLSTVEMLKALSDARMQVLLHLNDSRRTVSTVEELRRIAFNAYHDEEMATVVSEAVHRVGADGVVTVQESDTLETTVEVTMGMGFERGFVSGYMAPDGERSELKDTAVLICADPIASMGDIYGLLEKMLKTGRKSVFIVADSFTGDTIPSLVMSNARGIINAVAVQAPYQGEMRKEFLLDLAVITGGYVVDTAKGDELRKLEPETFGHADNIYITKNSTIVAGGSGDPELVKTHAATIKPEGRDGYNELRIARLTSGVARIKVGGATESEIKHKKAKIDDAVSATQLAFKSGVVPGGAKAFITNKIDNSYINQALYAPREILLTNGLGSLSDDAEDAYGVVKAAVDSAFSLAALLLNAGGIITKHETSVTGPRN